MSDDGERPRVATVEVTNAADTAELQALISLLEQRFAVEARMADGELYVLRDTSDTGGLRTGLEVEESQTRNVLWTANLSEHPDASDDDEAEAPAEHQTVPANEQDQPSAETTDGDGPEVDGQDVSTDEGSADEAGATAGPASGRYRGR